MKLLLIVLLSTGLFAKTKWNYDALLTLGWTVEIICKRGYLVEKVSIPGKGSIEEPVCYDISPWNRACNHPPVHCEKENK